MAVLGFSSPLWIILSLLLMQNVYYIFAEELPIKEFREGKIDARSEESKPKSVHIINELIPNVRNRRQAGSCFPPITCDFFAARSFDGTCNNINNPYWGASSIPFQRFLPAQYEDGVSTPRGTGRSPPLPRPRDVSVDVIGTAVTPPIDDGVSLMTMQWGQFIDHDCFLTEEETDKECCKDFRTSTPTSNSCMPINVTGDAFYSPKNVSCLPFSRSRPSPCFPGPRIEQTSLLTSFVDTSQVYGSDSNSATALREPGSHRMRFSKGEVSSCSANNPSYSCRTFLPIRTNNQSRDEFFAGDGRVEEQPGLISIHTLPIRMHNDLGDVLSTKQRNFCTTRECVFQYVRKIVMAIHQKITYADFLPIIVGTDAMEKQGLPLQPRNNPYFRGYNSCVDPTVRSVVATVCFRFGHSLIKNIFTLKPNNFTVELAKSFNNHNITTSSNSFPSYFLRGIAVDQAEEMDHIIVDAVHNFLFARDPFTFGEDLYARNIARARDHGIAPYPAWINRCGGAVNKFDDLNKYMPSAVVNTLNNLYGGRINDIDLFPAAMAENNVAGGILGPTCSCLISEFFHNAKYGDRYWFENPSTTNPWYFSEAQLDSIKNTTLASLICFYTGADFLPPDVFRKVSISNPLTACSTLTQKGIVKDITLPFWE